jgi:hypothetical protein
MIYKTFSDFFLVIVTLRGIVCKIQTSQKMRVRNFNFLDSPY